MTFALFPASAPASAAAARAVAHAGANVASYPKWQAWLREHRPPTLIAWGANDPSFIAAGATAFQRDLPDAEIHLLDAGHFALDEKTDEIAGLVLAFMAKHS